MPEVLQPVVPSDVGHSSAATRTCTDALPAVYLRPGEHYFGPAARVCTLLGSSAAITLWHPRLGLGGLCHFLLPARPLLGHREPDGRYGDEAFALLIRSAQDAGAALDECECRVFGGANLADAGGVPFADEIGTRNVACALHLVAVERVRPCSVDVGGDLPRVLEMLTATGEVRVRYEMRVPTSGPGAAPDLVNISASGSE